MRYLSILLLIGVTLKVNGQQINPVPDYIFRNQMSVGRNAPTDTAAYLSVGPRYGANKGFMPPMVIDTASITGTKRNGLLIFSIQKNNFAYWDSVRVRWADITASVDSLVYSTKAWRKKGDDSLAAIINTRTDTLLISTRAWRQKGLDSLARLEVSVSDTATMLSPYVRAAGFGLSKSGQSLLADSASMATRARVQKGIDSVAALSRVGGSGTTNYVPKFTASSTLGNSKLFDDGTNLFYNQTTQTYRRVTGLEFSNGFLYVKRNANVASLGLLGLRDSVATNVGGSIEFQATYRNSDGDPTEIARINGYRENATDLNTAGFLTINTKTGAGALTEAIRVNSSQESLFAIADAGNYRIQADGSIYNTGDAILAASSGAVSIGTTSTSNKLTVNSTGFGTAQYVYSNTATEGPMIITGNNASLGSSTINMVLRSYNASFVGSLFGQSVAGYTLIGSDGSSSNGMLLGAVTNDPIIIGTNNTERARITADGEALFGTTSDAGDFRVQVNGNAYVSSGIGIGGGNSGDHLRAIGSNVTIRAESTQGPIIRMFAGSVALLETVSANDLIFRVNGTEYQRLTTNGEILFGTTSDAGNFRVQVNGVARASDGLATGAPAGGTAATWKLGIVLAGSYTAASNYLQVDVGGTLYYIGLVTPN